jgi:hypothetical protein
MRGLSLHQPWANLIVHGYKQIETRSWKSAYRGRVIIHASQTRDWTPTASAWHAWFQARHLPPKAVADPYVYGALIGACRFDDCEPTDTFDVQTISEQEYAVGNYEPGRFAYTVSNPVAFRQPIAYRGHLGLWKVPGDLVELIERQLAGDE